MLGHRCPAPADVTLHTPEGSFPYCLLHVFAYLTDAVETGLIDDASIGVSARLDDDEAGS